MLLIILTSHNNIIILNNIIMNYKTLSAKKRKFIELINQKDIINLEVKDIIKRLGISRATYYRWLKNQKLFKTMQKDINNEVQEKIPEVIRLLLKKALQGDFRAIKMILEKYDNSDESTEKNLTPDEIINIIRANKKRETNNVNS